MTLELRIEMDSAAFFLDNGATFAPNHEAARILRQYAQEVEDMELMDATLRDVNGNTVGTARVRD